MTSRTLMPLAAGLIAAIVAFTCGVAVLLSGGTAGACYIAAPTSGLNTPAYDSEQIANARTIISTGEALNIPTRGWIIAVAVAIQESSLRNVDHGDQAGPDSRGLFQQRAAWGPLHERMDPATSARLFYTGGHAGQPGLLDIPNWQNLPLTRAANAVQRSAYPDAYADHEDDATALVTTMSPSAQPCVEDVILAGSPSSAAATAIAYARSQLGLPYEWGGDGPQAGDVGFDCSGLTHAAYQAAGIPIPRTAQTQYNAGPRLPPGQDPEPGDLVFYGTSPTHITHVGLIVAPGYMIDAPRTGARIRLERTWTSKLIGYSRPASRT
jgi:cell wall-associated NlpC family hydrolase